MDWDKLRVFHAVAEAGSFTHAGETLNLSQSAVSRQISGLEESLNVTLFHRHARGLMLTEQGELLYQTARDILSKLSMTEAMLTDSKETPSGPLKITTTFAFGSFWLARHLGAFNAAFPDISLTLLIDDDELDLSMREADVAIRMQPPRQPDLIQRHLTTINFHIYAARSYLEQHGVPQAPEELRNHLLITYPPRMRAPFQNANWLLEAAGIGDHSEAKSLFFVNNMLAILRAVESGHGIAVMPDFLTDGHPDIVRVLPEMSAPQVDARFLYPEEMRNSKRIGVFRDFLLERVAKTNF